MECSAISRRIAGQPPCLDTAGHIAAMKAMKAAGKGKTDPPA
jgi:hypothetical protein